MVTRVRTVLGDVPAGELGVRDAHDHLFIRTPVPPGLELDASRSSSPSDRISRGRGPRNSHGMSGVRGTVAP